MSEAATKPKPAKLGAEQPSPEAQKRRVIEAAEGAGARENEAEFEANRDWIAKPKDASASGAAALSRPPNQLRNGIDQLSLLIRLGQSWCIRMPANDRCPIASCGKYERNFQFFQHVGDLIR